MTEVPNITLALYAQTDVGMVRNGNEDNFLVLDLSTGQSWIANEAENEQLLTYGQGYYGALLAVSDGMGGALAGEVASRMAVETVRDRMLQLQAHDKYSRLSFEERLRLSIEEANLLIKEEGDGNPSHRGLGATFTAVATIGDRICLAQVGDSRAHLLRDGRIARITKDQSLVQQLIDAGQITEEEAETHQYRNVILQALGAHNHVNVEVSWLPLRQYDTLLLCSDGLTNKIQADEIARLVNDAPDLKSACHELVNLANERGGEDNITVVIAQFSGPGLHPPEDREPIAPEIIARPPDMPARISLADGEETRPLDDSQAGTAARRETQPIRTTANLPSAATPAQSEVARRRGPSTAVFGRDFDPDEEEQIAPLSDGSAPPGSNPDVDSVAGAGAQQPLSADDPDITRPAPADNHSQTRPSGNGFRLTPLKFFIFLLLLGVVATGAILARGYFQQTKRSFEQTPDGMAIRREKLKEDIGSRRGRLESFRTRLYQSSDERREELMKKLEEVNAELGNADQLLTENRFQEVDTTLKKIDNLISLLAEEIRNLTQIFPAPMVRITPSRI